MTSAGPGAGEARLTLELDGLAVYSRAVAIGPQTPIQRLSVALPRLVTLAKRDINRRIAAETKRAAGVEPAAE
ncbi:hypothetical protein [Leifsonia sp. WHRI 6310E]|uniref:hypothetical protein n=1 Tax=Leifsonia sp. WHRI 6310E TaxID=3162562 RepID=UPI0032EB0A9B